MECDSSSNEIPTARGDKSSLRAQLIEAQILDGQLGDGGTIDDLLIENYAASIADRNVRIFSRLTRLVSLHLQELRYNTPDSMVGAKARP